MSARNQHVVPRLGGRWGVRSTGSERATRVFDTQADAVSFARDIAARDGVELFVHGKDGMVRDHAVFGRDPSPSKG